MQRCARCGGSPGAVIMSMYNEDMICMQCKEDETKLESFAAARQAEFEAVKTGNVNFSGVGLTDRDRAELAKMRGER